MPTVTLLHGDCRNWTGPPPDLVFTHPYARLPDAVMRSPALINLALPRKVKQQRILVAEYWCGGALLPLASWALDGWNTVFVCRLPQRPVVLSDLMADAGGWFPITLVQRLLQRYRDLLPARAVVWDGFMGRGTVGKVAQAFGYDFIGIEQQAERVRMAEAYLGVPCSGSC